ncbi:MAG TPA: TIGR03118 family protein [Chitinophagaceae bacterium]
MKKELTKALQFAFTLLLLTISFSCQKNMNNGSANLRPGGENDIAPKELKNFVQLNLVGSSSSNKPLNIDPDLVNAMGISFPPSGPAWVSSEGKGLGSAYNLDGLKVGSPVDIPHALNTTTGHPTGHVYNPTNDFKLPNGNPAVFIFATSDGIISGWNLGSSAVKKIDHSSGASYLGVTLANDGSDFFIYAANFAQNRIDVFDENWNQVNTKPFIDPDLPAGYSPFNIQIISDGKLYVMYARKDATGKREIGPGHGYINIFNTNGTLLKRFASKGKLNAPWGITVAPAGFWGEFSLTQITNVILVGNNGDGHINAFDENGNFIGPLSTNGKAIEIDGLWGITFPPITGLNRYYLYFAAGPNNGSGGLVGRIKTKFLN